MRISVITTPFANFGYTDLDVRAYQLSTDEYEGALERDLDKLFTVIKKMVGNIQSQQGANLTKLREDARKLVEGIQRDIKEVDSMERKISKVSQGEKSPKVQYLERFCESFLESLGSDLKTTYFVEDLELSESNDELDHETEFSAYERNFSYDPYRKFLEGLGLSEDELEADIGGILSMLIPFAAHKLKYNGTVFIPKERGKKRFAFENHANTITSRIRSELGSGDDMSLLISPDHGHCFNNLKAMFEEHNPNLDKFRLVIFDSHIDLYSPFGEVLSNYKKAFKEGEQHRGHEVRKANDIIQEEARTKDIEFPSENADFKKYIYPASRLIFSRASFINYLLDENEFEWGLKPENIILIGPLEEVPDTNCLELARYEFCSRIGMKVYPGYLFNQRLHDSYPTTLEKYDNLIGSTLIPNDFFKVQYEGEEIDDIVGHIMKDLKGKKMYVSLDVDSLYLEGLLHHAWRCVGALKPSRLKEILAHVDNCAGADINEIYYCHKEILGRILEDLAKILAA